jgi:tRNA/rRNA methyltransferase
MNPVSPLDNVRIVLSHTSHPGNIGAAARAMKTMGLKKLYLINPVSFPDKEAEARSAGAWDILNEAVVCTSLDDALRDTTLAAAITARSRNLSHEVADSRQGATDLLEQAAHHQVALVFGTEMSGLTTAEISKCQLIIHIPADPNYSSLNLASAVQVIAYELRMALLSGDENRIPPPRSNPPATFDEIEFFYQHLEKSMIRSGFLDPAEPKRLMQRIRRLFARTRLEKEEVNILRGILTMLEKRKQEE